MRSVATIAVPHPTPDQHVHASVCIKISDDELSFIVIR
jgi:hypothetical protein